MPTEATAGITGSPPISNWWFKWDMTEGETEQLAKYDVVLVDVENQTFAPARLEQLRQLNPHITILAYVSLSDIRPDAASLDRSTFRGKLGNQMKKNPSWILKNASGADTEWWPTFKIFNPTDSTPSSTEKKFNKIFPKMVANNIYTTGLWDGVFLDNVWDDVSWVSKKIDLNQDGIPESAASLDSSWHAGIKKILKRIRHKTNPTWIITGNGGASYSAELNGIAFENFPNTSYGSWTPSMKEYAIIGNTTDFAFINSNDNNGGNSANYQGFRFGLTSTLLGEGYYSFDSGDQTHHELYFYDEYEVALGQALGAAYNTLDPASPTSLQEGVWRRDFENGIVLVNSTSVDRTYILEQGFEKIKGVQDVTTNSGKTVGSVTVSAHDGIILLNRLSSITGEVFINGAAAKVFDGSGNEVRNSFFTYDGTFSGGTKIIRLPDVGKIVVAGDTYVEVYDTAHNLLDRFAPYGETFTGGVDIAVNRLDGNKKPYRIVTGTDSEGPQVRIFNLKGGLVNAGCFPYPEAFRGGVHVAIGNVDGVGKKEIVVAPGTGGGPQVLILNTACQTLSTGFFAFDSATRFGLHIAVGDVTGDGIDDIIAAPGAGAGPQVRVFDQHGTLETSSFFAFDEADHSGVHVGASDLTGDGIDEIIVNSFSVFNSL